MIKKVLRMIEIIAGAITGISLVVNNKFDDFIKILFSTDTLYIIIFILISYVIVVNVHEFGHFIFGRLNGYKLLKYKLGILTFELENNKYKLSIEKPKGYYGYCIMIPTQHTLSRKNNIMLYSGGVIMNLLTVIITATLLLLNLSSSLHTFLLILMLYSLIIFLYNLIPFKTYNNPSDGFILIELIKNSDISKKIININIYVTKLSSGARPRDIEELNNMEIPDGKIDVMEIYQLAHLLYNAIDKNDKTKIRKLADILENNKDKVPSILEIGLNSELCYCYSILGDLEKAKNYYNKVKNKLETSNDSSSNRIKAYYEFNYDKNKSLEYCDKGLSSIELYPVRGIAIMEKELLINLKNVLDKNIYKSI